VPEHPPFRFSARTRVGFSDTDAQSVVYYGRYNPYFDLARVEYLRVARIGHTSVTFAFAAYREPEDALMVTADQTVVLVDPEERRSKAIPDGWRRRVEAFEAGE
jgi:acyl-CoA thioesterase FadM